MTTSDFDFILVGGGTVGAAIGFGLACRGRRIAIFDGADRGLRAARTNFGLVWVQGKGDGFQPYQRVTRESSDLWPDFSRYLEEISGIRIEYSRSGGLVYCLSSAELEEEDALSRRMVADDPAYEYEILDRSRLEALLPSIAFGPRVTGACYSPLDGHVNPLSLLSALLKGFSRLGGNYQDGCPVEHVEALAGGGFAVHHAEGISTCEKVVITAGNHSPAFGGMLDLPIHVRPQRGQLLITERVAPVLPFAGIGIRQAANGSFQLGGTYENVGLSTEVSLEGASSIAKRAAQVMPDLAKLLVVRQWAGLRVLSPDGFPIYDHSRTLPGAYVALCHSGVTLAAFHAGPLANHLAEAADLNPYRDFTGRRFETEKAT